MQVRLRFTWVWGSERLIDGIGDGATSKAGSCSGCGFSSGNQDGKVEMRRGDWSGSLSTGQIWWELNLI